MCIPQKQISGSKRWTTLLLVTMRRPRRLVRSSHPWPALTITPLSTSSTRLFNSEFVNGMNATVSNALSAIQGPLTAAVVLWIIVTGVLVMRGDLDARRGITRILSVCLVVGILTSAVNPRRI